MRGQDALNDCMRDHGGFEHNLQSLRVVVQLEERYPPFDGPNLTFETREGIVKHCLRANAEKLEAAQPHSVDDVRLEAPLVRLGTIMRQSSAALKRFLFQNLYRHPQVAETTAKVQEVVRELFAVYRADPAQMQADFAARRDPFRSVSDYIAGITDRFAAHEHERLTGRKLFS